MANNVTLDPMSGGKSVKTTEDGSQQHHQHVEVEFDVGGTPTPVSSAAPLPVDDDAAQALLTDIETAVDGVETQLAAANTSLDNIEADADASAASLAIMDDWDNGDSDGASVSGNVADGTADAGEPVKVGGKAVAHGSNPTAVDAGDRVNAHYNRHGIPFVQPGHPNIITKSARVDDADGAQTDAALITVSAGTKIVVVGLDVMCDKANTVDVGMRVGFGTANVPTPAETGVTGIVFEHPGIAAGSGVVKGYAGGILAVGGDGEDLRFTCEDPTTGAVVLTVSYYTIES